MTDKPVDPHLVAQLKEQIEYLAKNNGGIKSLNYFYEVFKELYNAKGINTEIQGITDKRSDEVLIHNRSSGKINGKRYKEGWLVYALGLVRFGNGMLRPFRR